MCQFSNKKTILSAADWGQKASAAIGFIKATEKKTSHHFKNASHHFKNALIPLKSLAILGKALEK
jgi:hypothetical protein